MKRIAIHLPRFATPTRCVCECQKKIFDLEYKSVVVMWQVKQGDYVHKGQAICEAEIEKAVIEIEAPADGYLDEICVQDGEPGDIGHPLGYINPIPT